MGVTEWVVISGKGGTGKTSVTAALAALAGPVVLTDADVDGANLALVLQARQATERRFEGRRKAAINPSRCVACGRCADECRFEAVLPSTAHRNGGMIMRVDPDACEGCGLCARICPADAIAMKKTTGGTWRRSESEWGTLFHARLEPGGENSGKLVALLRQEARRHAEGQGIPHLLTDGPPGSGCPVIATLTGTQSALIVTEPTPSGRSDAERVLDLCRHFRRPVALAINKADLHPRTVADLESWARERELPVVGRLPYDPAVPAAIRLGVPATTLPASPWSDAVRAMVARLGLPMRPRRRVTRGSVSGQWPVAGGWGDGIGDGAGSESRPGTDREVISSEAGCTVCSQPPTRRDHQRWFSPPNRRTR